MNKHLANMMEHVVPKFNRNVVDGLATKWVANVIEYIDDIIKNNMRTAPKELKYLGIRRLSAKEEFYQLEKSGKIHYDLARYDVFKVELMFTYKDEPIPNRYLYLPFTNDAGITHLTDTKYHFISVLSDTVISPTYKDVFIRLLRAKLLFLRVNRNILINGKVFTGEVVYSETIKTDKREIEDRLGKVVPPIAIYLMAEYGIIKTFKKYLDTDIIITNNISKIKDIDRYDIYTTTGTKIKQLKEQYYHGHNISLLMLKEKRTPLSDNIIASIIYTLDIFPALAIEMMETINSGNVSKEIDFWRVLLSRIIFKDGYKNNRGRQDVDDHFLALQSYADNLIKQKLAETGVVIETFFDLIVVILKNYNTWVLHSKTFKSDIKNRYMDVLYYILYPIIEGINKTIYETVKKCSKKDLTINEVTSIFNSNLKLRQFFTIKQGSAISLALQLCDYPGDNKYFKITSIMSLQELGKGVTKSPSSFPPSMRYITATDLYLGSVLNLPKSTPSPKVRINPWANICVDTGRILIPDKTAAKLNKLDNLLHGKISNEKDIDFDTVMNTEIDIE